jgi:hypothetical protein
MAKGRVSNVATIWADWSNRLDRPWRQNSVLYVGRKQMWNTLTFHLYYAFRCYFTFHCMYLKVLGTKYAVCIENGLQCSWLFYRDGPIKNPDLKVNCVGKVQWLWCSWTWYCIFRRSNGSRLNWLRIGQHLCSSFICYENFGQTTCNCRKGL